MRGTGYRIKPEMGHSWWNTRLTCRKAHSHESKIRGLAWHLRGAPGAHKANSQQRLSGGTSGDIVGAGACSRWLAGQDEGLTVSDRHWHMQNCVCRCYGKLVSTKQSKIITARANIPSMARRGKSSLYKVFKKRGRTHVRAAGTMLVQRLDFGLMTPAREYGRRNWQEQSFRDESIGRGASSKMTRLIAILVIAYAWTLSLGCRAVEQGQVRSLNAR